MAINSYLPSISAGGVFPVNEICKLMKRNPIELGSFDHPQASLQNYPTKGDLVLLADNIEQARLR